MEPRATSDELLGGCWPTGWSEAEDDTDPRELEQELQRLVSELVACLVD